ncbi:4'-phosphopantetheinyl transferase [Streptomyces noursei]|uniref:4'-phosphopantetheinyl transferase family protein n=1 Tax=Streptomyces TaxID=1883 RepID=UPI0035D9CBB2
MITQLVPAGVRTHEAFGDTGPEATVVLFAAEQAAVAGVFEERRREFTTVRGCARAALGRIGVRPVPLVPGALGAPGWPAGVVGSMTHCRGYRAAAVARAADFAAVGIDAEPQEPLPRAVADRIVTDTERGWLGEEFPRGAGVPLDRVLFCAKEASYKAFSPWTGARFGFGDYRVRLRADGTFRTVPPDAVLTAAGPWAAGFTGRWSARSGLVFTAVALVANPGAPEQGREPVPGPP